MKSVFNGTLIKYVYYIQNSSIYEGLMLWKSSLDKRFDGVEECYICFSIVHHDISNLPKITCRTCKKKFHGPCLVS